MEHSLFYSPEYAKTRTSESSYLSVWPTVGSYAHVGASLFWTGIPSFLACPPRGGLSPGSPWVSSTANCQWQVSTGETSWLRRRQKGDATMSHLVLIVMTLLTPFESCLWISGLPRTLLCSLDHRRPTQATETRQSSTRGHRLRMWFRHRTMNFPHLKKFLWQTQTVLPEGLDFTYKVKRWQADARGCCPVLQSRINVDWLTFDPQMFAPLFPRLKEGILRDVFIQKAVAAWDNAPSNRIMVSLLLPGPMEMDQWLKDVRASINMWPLQKTAHVVTNQMATEVFMRRERRRLQARHIWEKIEPDWPMIRARVWTKQATGLPYDALHRRLFLHDYTEESRWLENSYRGPHWRWVQQQWKNCQAWFAGQAVARSPSQWISTLYLHGLDQLDALSWQWINQHENLSRTGLAHTAGNLPTQTSTGRERWSHAWPVKVHLYALVGCVINVWYSSCFKLSTAFSFSYDSEVAGTLWPPALPLAPPCRLDRAHAPARAQLALVTWIQRRMIWCIFYR